MTQSKRNDIKQLLNTQIMTSGEVCKALKVTRQRFCAIAQEGTLTSIASNSAQTLYLRYDVDKYVAEKIVNSEVAAMLAEIIADEHSHGAAMYTPQEFIEKLICDYYSERRRGEE